MPALPLVLVLSLSLVHVFAGRIRFLSETPRSRWLSIAGGVSVAYVFVHILPDLEHHRSRLQETVAAALPAATYHVYLLALLGLVVFYGLERLARRSRARAGGSGDAPTTAPVFWIHITSFAIYNALIGYLMVHREVPGTRSLVFFFLAMATHFLVNDYALRRDHKERYHRYGRWLIAATVVAGWATGMVSEVNELVLASLFAFLAGGVILNVLKEELPEERESAFFAFAAGAFSYAALLVFT
jgi:hypothetical protein